MIAGGIQSEPSTQSPTDRAISLAQGLNNIGNQYAYSVDSNGNFSFIKDANGNPVLIDENVQDANIDPTLNLAAAATNSGGASDVGAAYTNVPVPTPRPFVLNEAQWQYNCSYC